jgi:hypothetical protein
MVWETRMDLAVCPECGVSLAVELESCPACGCPLNGAVPSASASPRRTVAADEQLSVGRLSPALLEWARQQFDEEEFRLGLEEVRETGGLEVKGFIQELEHEALTVV